MRSGGWDLGWEFAFFVLMLTGVWVPALVAAAAAALAGAGAHVHHPVALPRRARRVHDGHSALPRGRMGPCS